MNTYLHNDELAQFQAVHLRNQTCVRRTGLEGHVERRRDVTGIYI